MSLLSNELLTTDPRAPPTGPRLLTSAATTPTPVLVTQKAASDKSLGNLPEDEKGICIGDTCMAAPGVSGLVNQTGKFNEDICNQCNTIPCRAALSDIYSFVPRPPAFLEDTLRCYTVEMVEAIRKKRPLLGILAEARIQCIQADYVVNEMKKRNSSGNHGILAIQGNQVQFPYISTTTKSDSLTPVGTQGRACAAPGAPWATDRSGRVPPRNGQVRSFPAPRAKGWSALPQPCRVFFRANSTARGSLVTLNARGRIGQTATGQVTAPGQVAFSVGGSIFPSRFGNLLKLQRSVPASFRTGRSFAHPSIPEVIGPVP